MQTKWTFHQLTGCAAAASRHGVNIGIAFPADMDTPCYQQEQLIKVWSLPQSACFAFASKSTKLLILFCYAQSCMANQGCDFCCSHQNARQSAKHLGLCTSQNR